MDEEFAVGGCELLQFAWMGNGVLLHSKGNSGGWVTLLHNRDGRNIVNRSYCNFFKKTKKKNCPLPKNITCSLVYVHT